MTAQAIKAAEELSASRLNWKRLRRLALNCGLLACAVSGTVFYMNGGVSGVLLRADGLVLRERVAVAPAFEGRVYDSQDGNPYCLTGECSRDGRALPHQACSRCLN
jgi:hypothetical protein